MSAVPPFASLESQALEKLVERVSDDSLHHLVNNTLKFQRTGLSTKQFGLFQPAINVRWFSVPDQLNEFFSFPFGQNVKAKSISVLGFQRALDLLCSSLARLLRIASATYYSLFYKENEENRKSWYSSMLRSPPDGANTLLPQFVHTIPSVPSSQDAPETIKNKLKEIFYQEHFDRNHFISEITEMNYDTINVGFILYSPLLNQATEMICSIRPIIVL